MVGPPHKTWYSRSVAEPVQYWQGVHIEIFEELASGGFGKEVDCAWYFSNRSTYVGPRSVTGEAQQANARANHFDGMGLGCGYSGSFRIMCVDNGAGQCSLDVDISTCVPPTYTTALDDCYTVPTTTTLPQSDQPTVSDFLAVEEIPMTMAALPKTLHISTQTTTPYPCCEVHVGSECRIDIPEYSYPAATVDGRWNPDASYQGQAGYFTVTPCDRQAESQPRLQCPRVRFTELDTGYKQWAPVCGHVCNMAMAQAKLEKVCNRTAHPEIEEMEKTAHDAKKESMKTKAKQLEDWTRSRMPTVPETKQVVDCFSDRLPSRYNSLALPQMRSGFEKMPLEPQCRMHGCKPTQCLEVKYQCRVPWVHEYPEVDCNIYRANGTFKCVDKVGIMTNNPMSLGFGIAWMVIGSLFCCAGIASFVRGLDVSGAGYGRQVETTTLATRQ